MNKVPIIILSALFLTISFVGSALASDGLLNEPTAIYEGRRVPLAKVWSQSSAVHCHDAAGKGELTCYDTVEEVDLDLIKRGVAPQAIAENYPDVQESSSSKLEGLDGSCYIRLWDAINYDDSYPDVLLCHDYNDLRTIYSNDRASSVEAFDPGYLHSAINFGGTPLGTLLNIPDLRVYDFNDIASSVSRR